MSNTKRVKLFVGISLSNMTFRHFNDKVMGINVSKKRNVRSVMIN